MGAEASFGPSLEVFDQLTKPLELKLSATTTSTGQNSVDLKLLAFTYELDSYNIANSTTPLEYISSVGWSLPNAVSGTMGDTYDCDTWFTDSCSLSWSATPLLATVGGIFVLRVNSHGVEAHALAAANAHSSVAISGSATGHGITISASGSGVINYMRGLYWGSATLAPYNSHWAATAESSINVEDVFGAKVKATVDLSDIGHDPVDHTFVDKAPTSFSNLWSYGCTFDKDWK
jgi:hypothetical protein